MRDMLEMTYGSQHRQDRFDDHTHIPTAARAYFQVGRVALFGEEDMLRQNQHLIFELEDQGMKNGVIDVGGGAVKR